MEIALLVLTTIAFAIAGWALHRQQFLERARAESETRAQVAEARLAAERAAQAQQLSALEAAREQLTDAFRATGAQALHESQRTFLDLAEQRFRTLLVEQVQQDEKSHMTLDALVTPMRELLAQQNKAIGELERKREVAYAAIVEKVGQVSAAHERLGTETGRLVNALAKPHQRGRWGELQLTRVVEIAGMAEHCDFSVQVQVKDGDATRIPDLVVHLPRGGQIVVDSKVALDAYLQAIAPEADRNALLALHARQLRDQVNGLAKKEYWKQFERTPDLVVMFVPIESALTAAMEADPALHADALANRVLIATPTLLIGLLRALAYGWQQEAIAENARQIADVGKQLHDRLEKFVDHFAHVGSRLQQAVESYNGATGALEHRVLVSARKLRALGSTAADELEVSEPIDVVVRSLDGPRAAASEGAHGA